jgi:hypothetical protein
LSSIDLAAVSDLDDPDLDGAILDPCQYAEIAHSIFPKSEERTGKRSTEFSRIVPLRQPDLEKVQDTALVSFGKLG